MPSRFVARLLPPLVALAIVVGFTWYRWVKVLSTFGVDPPVAPVALDPGPERWLKGQFHLHSSNSGDSDTPPLEVARWYAAHGYDFIVFTDHNHVTQLPPVGGMLVLPGLEITQNTACVPPPAEGGSCPLHVNALFLDPTRVVDPAPAASHSRLDLYGRAIDAALAMGGLVQINHPNYGWAVDAELLTALAHRGASLVEIANQALDADNAGDAHHPSTEALWDAALDRGAHLDGVASDDAHHYADADAVVAAGHTAFRGDLGFVMVHARQSLEAIKAAVQQGDFYASTGVLLSRVEQEGTVVVVEAASPGVHRFQLIGPGGVVAKEISGREARFDLAGLARGRVVVTGPTGKQAWTQPLLPAAPGR